MPTSLPDILTKRKSLSTAPLPDAADDDDTCIKELDKEDPPPLGFKVTGYRLLNVAVIVGIGIVGIGIVKAVAVYRSLCRTAFDTNNAGNRRGDIFNADVRFSFFKFHGNTGPS